MVSNVSKRMGCYVLVALLIACCIAVGTLLRDRQFGFHNLLVPIENAVDNEDTLTCQIYLNQMLMGNNSDHQHSHHYVCCPIYDGIVDDRQYRVELPDDIIQEHEAHLGDLQRTHEFGVRIPGGLVDEESATIIYPSNSTITSFSLPSRRRLGSSTGYQSILVVMVYTLDAAPSYSGGQIYNTLFVGTSSLFDQFRMCSYGKLYITPTGAGTINVWVNQYARSGNYNAIANAAVTAATNELNRRGLRVSSAGSYANHVMYILPKTGTFLAYGSIGGGTTVYNDKWGAYLATQAHEIGHNFGLTHANQGGEYQDYTGYMSGSIYGYHDRERFPLECYNAYHSYMLGWYFDRTIAVNPYYPRKVYLAGAVDYGITRAGYYTVASVGSLYLMYNRAKGFNSGTYEYRDNLVIVQNRGSTGTELIAALSLSSNPKMQVYDSSTRNYLTVQVCRSYPGRYPNPDLLEVSIGYGGSLCGYSSTTAAFAQDQAFAAAPDGDAGYAETTVATEECRRLSTGSLCTSDSDCCSGRCEADGDSYITYCT